MEPDPEDSEVKPSPDIPAFNALLAKLLPQLSQVITTGFGLPYTHSILATTIDFRLGTPADSVIPSKEPSRLHRIPIKQLSAWTIKPDLKTFGPYFKSAGVDYSPLHISTLAHAIPDVHLCS